MAMLGKVEDLLEQIHPQRRLRRGLSVLMDYCEGRLPEFERILARLKAGEKLEVAIEGENLYAILQCYAPKPREQGRFEAHQRYTDLQYLCEGEEWIEVCDLRAQANLPPFDTNGNIYFPLMAATPTRLRLGAAELAVLFPHDAHAPCLRVDDAPDRLVRKIVIKVKDAHLMEDSGSP
jgi:YhcH/YjgK/YiaL family protein